MAGQSYQDAIDSLGTLISKQKRSSGSDWEACFDAMKVFLERLQLVESLKQLKVVHVAGTKGKGSTCCMVEAMLRASGYKTGLYTSPHLLDVRERIRIGGRPVKQEVFIHNFWECFETFRSTSTEKAGMPAYFRFLTLLGLKIFIEEKVDVVILEVGLGGRLDATNIVPSPIVCGVSSLGFDHMELLGHTLKEIATEKAGILKKGSPAVTVPQPDEAQNALQAKADEVGVVLQVARPLERYKNKKGQRPLIGLRGSHQEVNAALAIALAGEFEARQDSEQAQENARSISEGHLPDSYSKGLAAASWPGRCQIIRDTASAQNGPGLVFHLDGAHTPESMVACADWFSDAIAEQDEEEGSNLQHNSGEPQALDPGGQRNPQANGHSSQPGNLQANGHSSQLGNPQANEHSSQPASPKANGHSSGKTAALGPRVAANLLIFNCMQEREPERLLGALLNALRSRGTSIQHAVFVPPDSLYSKPSFSTTEEGQRDLSWQLKLRNTWDSLLPQQQNSQLAAQGTKLLRLPPVSKMLEQDSSRGAVLPGLRTTLAWLRSCARQNAGMHIRVLVTGSLYLVGDMLRHLGQDV